MERDYINCNDLPMGLSMALARNIPAMEQFSKMETAQKESFISGCKKVRSKKEMQEYVNRLAQSDIS